MGNTRSKLEMSISRRESFAALAMLIAGGGCSGRPEQSPQQDALERLAKHFERPVVEPVEPMKLHGDHAKSVALPVDYQRYLATFGPGEFNDQRLQIAVADLTSANESTALDLFAVLDHRDYLCRGQKLTAFPDVPGVLPWGHDFQEMTFYWIATSEDPEAWEVAVTGGDSLMAYPGTMVEFLTACLLDGDPFAGLTPLFDRDQLAFTPA